MNTSDANRTPVPDAILEAALDAWDEAGGQHLISITGESMLPLIQDGDRVLVAHGSTGVRRGDVVVFWREGRLIAHRVLRILGGDVCPIFVSKGDNVSWLDSPLSADEVVGRVLLVRRSDLQMSLNTTAWRTVGWLIAVIGLAWIKLYGWSRTQKSKFSGPESNRLTAFLHRPVRTLSSLLLRVTQVVFCRWEPHSTVKRKQ